VKTSLPFVFLRDEIADRIVCFSLNFQCERGGKFIFVDEQDYVERMEGATTFTIKKY
jgi:hypothetical protein